MKKESKRFFVNVILSVGFILVIAAGGLFLTSEIFFYKAQMYGKSFSYWSKAGEAYKKAIFFSPFNARYLTGLADFLIRKSIYIYEKNRPLEIEKAEGLYKRAIRLNPRSAPNFVSLGRIQIKLFLTNKDIYKDKLSDGLANLKMAIINDPNGFDTSFFVGSIGLTIWDYLKESERKFIIDAFSIALNARPWESKEHIFSSLWQQTKDPKALSQLYLKQKRILDSYRERANPTKFSREKEEIERLLRSVKPLAIKGGSPRWVGKSFDWQQTYERGNMIWPGTIHTLITLPKGKVLININARGSLANGIFPYMAVEIDGEELGGELLSDSWWREYSFEADTDGGIKTLSVTFVNDVVNEETREDRNLYVGDIRIIKDER